VVDVFFTFVGGDILPHLAGFGVYFVGQSSVFLGFHEFFPNDPIEIHGVF
jgi:hypothetical protein